MLVLVPVALAVTVWALTAGPDAPIGPAARRPPGDATVTVARGGAELGTALEEESGPACAGTITIVGDVGARAAGARALAAVCDLVRSGDLPRSAEGLGRWLTGAGRLRFAVFELTGVESSARLEDGRVVIELNAKFVFDDGRRAGPALVHQLALLAQPTWPGAPITAATALDAAREEARACELAALTVEGPRGCLDVAELLGGPDPLGALADVGYPR